MSTAGSGRVWARKSLSERATSDGAGVMAVFGSLGFWFDGHRISCAVLAPGSAAKFTIYVRPEAC